MITKAYSLLTVTFFPLRTQFASPPCKDAGGVDNIEFLKGQSVTAVFNDEHPNSPAVIEGVVIKKGTETVYNLRFHDQSFRKGVPANEIKALSSGTRSVLSARSMFNIPMGQSGVRHEHEPNSLANKRDEIEFYINLHTST